MLQTLILYIEVLNLRKLYHNKKKQVPKQVAEERKQVMLTGGGPPPHVEKNPCFDLILSIINEKTVGGLKSFYDDDADDGIHIKNPTESECLWNRYVRIG